MSDYHAVPDDCIPVCDLPAGKKFDSGKPEFSLIPPLALEEVAKVLTFGAEKYGRENWRDVPEAKRRYLDAALRHLNAYRATAGAPDPESQHSHLAHAIASLSFILELELEGLDRDAE